MIAGRGVTMSAGKTGVPSLLEKIISLGFDYTVTFTMSGGRELFRTPVIKITFSLSVFSLAKFDRCDRTVY